MRGWLSVRDTGDAGSAAEDFHPPGGRAPSQSWGRGNTRAARLHPVLASRRHCGGSPLGLPDGGGRAGAAELGCGLACATTKPTPPPGPGSLSCPHPCPEVQQCKERATVSGRGKWVGRRAGCALRPGSPGGGRSGGTTAATQWTHRRAAALSPGHTLQRGTPGAQAASAPALCPAIPTDSQATTRYGPSGWTDPRRPPELRLGLHAQHPSLI